MTEEFIKHTSLGLNIHIGTVFGVSRIKRNPKKDELRIQIEEASSAGALANLATCGHVTQGLQGSRRAIPAVPISNSDDRVFYSMCPF